MAESIIKDQCSYRGGNDVSLGAGESKTYNLGTGLLICNRTHPVAQQDLFVVIAKAEVQAFIISDKGPATGKIAITNVDENTITITNNHNIAVAIDGIGV